MYVSVPQGLLAENHPTVNMNKFLIIPPTEIQRKCKDRSWTAKLVIKNKIKSKTNSGLVSQSYLLYCTAVLEKNTDNSHPISHRSSQARWKHPHSQKGQPIKLLPIFSQLL